MKKMQRSRGKQTSKSWKRRQQLNLNCLNVWQQIQWRIQGRGARGLGPTLFLDQTEAAGPKGRKNFFWRPPRPLSQGLDPALKYSLQLSPCFPCSISWCFGEQMKDK